MNSHFPHRCLNVLGNEVRCKILEELRKKPMTVQELCKETKKEQSVISHALQQLRECKFVSCNKKGKEREYYLSSEIFTKASGKPLFEMIEEHAQKYCGK